MNVLYRGVIKLYGGVIKVVRAALPVAPESVMHHSQGTGRPFIIVCETLGVEEFHDRRTRGRLHPNE